MILYRDEHAALVFDADKKELIQTWQNYVPTDVFRKVIDLSVEFVDKHQVESLISDTLRQKVVSSDDAVYAASVIPVLFRNGLKAMAFVIPENVFTKFSLKKFADASLHDYIGYFSNMDEACKWIEVLTSDKVKRPLLNNL